jgi:DNA-binding Lrp family transcriptional regulator
MRQSPNKRMTQEEGEILTKKLVQAVVQNPGQPVRVLAKQVGFPPERVSYYLRDLVANKTLKRTGNRMSTKYFPAK